MEHNAIATFAAGGLGCQNIEFIYHYTFVKKCAFFRKFRTKVHFSRKFRKKRTLFFRNLRKKCTEKSVMVDELNITNTFVYDTDCAMKLYTEGDVQLRLYCLQRV